MRRWREFSLRIVYVAVLLSFISVGQVRADAVPYPVEPPPSQSIDHPIHKLAPSPEGGMSALAVTAGAPLQVITDPLIDMKVLVIIDSSILVNGNPEPDGVNQMITSYLDILGIPYDIVDVNGRADFTTPLITDSMLWDGVNHGHYYAIFVGNNLVWWPATYEGLSPDERALIQAYERNFNVRQVTWYGYPSPTLYGLDPVTATGQTITTTLTTEGADVFNYLRSDIQLPISGAYTYLATVSAGAVVTPLLTFSDPTNIYTDTTTGPYPIVSIFSPTDSGDQMVVTADAYYPSDPPLNIHGRLLPYGIINWATKGVFLGERHLYFTPQPDDMLSYGDRWDVSTHSTVFNVGYRLKPSDVDNLIAWQNTFRATMPNASDFKIEMPFNGEGADYDTDPNTGQIISGTLTAKVMQTQNNFVWLNHTWSHLDLYTVDYATAHSEVYSNTVTAHDLGFTDYTTGTLLTGAYSGLTNTNVINAAYDLGVRYMLSNASQPGYGNPKPNTGIYTGTNGKMLLVPRLANNIFYFAGTPAEEVDYYNLVYDAINDVYYCKAYYDSAPTYDQSKLCYDYQQILDRVTNQALGYLLDFNVDATMYHMNNLNQYSAPLSNTLMGDYVTALYSKYNTYYSGNVPILSPRTQEIGDLMQQRMDYNASGVSGIIGCANEITLTVPADATTGARVPVTGVDYGSDTESYAGQMISYVQMGIDSTVHIPGSASPSTPGAVANLQVVSGSTSRTLTWDAVTGAYGYRVYRSGTAGFTPDSTNEIAVVTSPSYVDSSGSADSYYAVTAIADDCWKHESSPSYVSLSTTALTLIGLDATSTPALSLASMVVLPLVVLAALGFRRRRQA